MAKKLAYAIQISVDGKEVKLATSELKKLGRAVDAARTSGKKAIDTGFLFSSLQSAISSLTSTVHTFTAAYAAQERAELQLANAMRNTMGAMDGEIQAVKELTAAQQQLGVIGDEVQMAGANVLATHLKSAEALKKLIPAMNDMAVAQEGLNVTQSTTEQIGQLFGKAMDGNTGALKRVGIQLTSTQEEMMKTGTEMERAAVIAEAVEARFGGMNEELAKTDAGKAKQAANAFGDWQEKVGKLLAPYQQLIEMTGQLSMTLGALFLVFRSLYASLGPLIARIMTLIAGERNIAFMSRGAVSGLAALRGMLTGVRVSATTAAFAVKGLTVAIKTLGRFLIVGAIIEGVIWVIQQLTGASDDASESINGLSESEQRAAEASDAIALANETAAKTYGQARAEMDKEIAKLEQLIKSKGDQRAVVQDLNEKYGESFGVYSTAAQWYDTLIAKSEAYCNQLAYEAEARLIAERKGEIQFKLDQNRQRQEHLAETQGNVMVQHGDPLSLSGGATYSEYYDPSDLKNPGNGSTETRHLWISEEMRKEREEAADLIKQKRQLDKIEQENEQRRAEARRSLGTPTTFTTGVGVGNGRGNAATTTDTPKPEVFAEGSIKWYEKELRDLRDKIEREADSSVAAGYQATYEETEKALKAKKLEIGIEKAEPEEVKTYVEDLRTQLEDATKELESATTVEARVEAAAKVDKIQGQIEEATRGKVTIAAEVEPSFIKQGSIQDKRMSYDNARSRADRIKQDYDIGILGEGEAINAIEGINKELEKLGLTALDVNDIMGKQSAKAFDTFKKGWGAVQGVGNGIQDITESLNGQKNAWEAVNGLVDSFIQIYEGIRGVIEVLQLLGILSKAHAAEKAAEGGVVATEASVQAAASAENAAAMAVETAAAKASTAAFLELAAAGYMAAHAYIPFAGFGIAAGFTASAAALVKSMGAMAFAEGGIISGPTLGLIGEYAGAKNNPEVVAPLDKLRSLMGDGGIGGQVDFRIRGRRLEGILKKEERHNSRG